MIMYSTVFFWSGLIHVILKVMMFCVVMRPVPTSGLSTRAEDVDEGVFDHLKSLSYIPILDAVSTYSM